MSQRDEPHEAWSATAELPRSLARRLPEGTMAWAIFQPNAPGRGELRGYQAFVRRQILKSQHCYLAERVLVAVGESQVGIWQALPGRWIARRLGLWERDQLFGSRVEPVGVRDIWMPAFRLHVERVEPGDVVRHVPIAELRAVRDEVRSKTVTELLIGRAPSRRSDPTEFQ